VNTVHVTVGNITTKIKQGVTNHCLKDVLSAVMQCKTCTSTPLTKMEKEHGKQLILNSVWYVK